MFISFSTCKCHLYLTSLFCHSTTFRTICQRQRMMFWLKRRVKFYKLTFIVTNMRSTTRVNKHIIWFTLIRLTNHLTIIIFNSITLFHLFNFDNFHDFNNFKRSICTYFIFNITLISIIVVYHKIKTNVACWRSSFRTCITFVFISIQCSAICCFMSISFTMSTVFFLFRACIWSVTLTLTMVTNNTISDIFSISAIMSMMSLHYATISFGHDFFIFFEIAKCFFEFTKSVIFLRLHDYDAKWFIFHWQPF